MKTININIEKTCKFDDVILIRNELRKQGYIALTIDDFLENFFCDIHDIKMTINFSKEKIIKRLSENVYSDIESLVAKFCSKNYCIEYFKGIEEVFTFLNIPDDKQFIIESLEYDDDYELNRLND